jgi:hypothetical protein
MGHAQIIVNGGYARLPEDDIVVHNVSEGADKESRLRRVPTALLKGIQDASGVHGGRFDYTSSLTQPM